MTRSAARRGRPFRALGGLLLLLALWLGWRMPVLGARVGEAAALLLPRVAAPPARRVAANGAPAAIPQVKLPRGPAQPVRRMAGPRRQGAPMPIAPAAPAQPAATAAPAAPAPAPAAVPVVPNLADPVHSSDATALRLALSAYDRLRTGNRRQAAALFDAALSLADNPQWLADRAALRRRWQLGGFALLRDGGSAGPAASPVLGGGQLGGSIAFLPDPYARRPLALVARANVAADVAADFGGVRSDTALAAIGVRQALAPGVSISAERLIAIGSATRGDWTLRLAAGGAIGGNGGRLRFYGEAGVLGSGQAYAGAQAAARVLRFGPATLSAATWASLQTGTPPITPDVWRVDVGPSVSIIVKGVRVAADWRQRIGGNAAPNSGPAVTISAGF